MCAVSVIAEYGRSQVPQRDLEDRYARFLFQEMLSAARRFDKATDQPDCASEEKTEWLDAQKFYY